MIEKIVEVELDEFDIEDIISHVRSNDRWPTIKDFDDDEILEAFEERELKVRPDDDDDPIKDVPSLNDAIDQARWGNIGMAAHYLQRAIPGLAPLAKILGA